jgi:hypothetical protein
MFRDGEGLEKDIKFTIASSYDAFSKKWCDLSSPKLGWVDTWSNLLSKYSIQTIRCTTKHFLQESLRSPTLPEFRIYCERVEKNEILHGPIVSVTEKIARKILETSQEELGYSDLHELSDALLVAALIATAKASESVGLEWSYELMESEFKGRAGMFGSESILWKKEAEKGKGYWADILGRDENNDE